MRTRHSTSIFNDGAVDAIVLGKASQARVHNLCVLGLLTLRGNIHNLKQGRETLKREINFGSLTQGQSVSSRVRDKEALSISRALTNLENEKTKLEREGRSKTISSVRLQVSDSSSRSRM